MLTWSIHVIPSIFLHNNIIFSQVFSSSSIRLSSIHCYKEGLLLHSSSSRNQTKCPCFLIRCFAFRRHISLTAIYSVWYIRYAFKNDKINSNIKLNLKLREDKIRCRSHIFNMLSWAESKIYYNERILKFCEVERSENFTRPLLELQFCFKKSWSVTEHF